MTLGISEVLAAPARASRESLERARVHREGPPPAHTGGFGEPTCIECHFGAGLNEPGSTLEVRGLPATYRPGATYRLTIRLESFEMGAAGFQAAIRRSDGTARGMSAGIFRPVDDRTTVAIGADGSVRYAQHRRAGTEVSGDVAEWHLEWTAPERTGTLSLHVAANSGNGDDSPLSDLVYTLASTLTPETSPSMPGGRQSSALGRQ